MMARLCPRCGQEIRRVQRHFTDRMLSVFVTVFRYRCDEPQCGWEGLVCRSPAGTAAYEDEEYVPGYRLEASCSAQSSRAVDPLAGKNA